MKTSQWDASLMLVRAGIRYYGPTVELEWREETFPGNLPARTLVLRIIDAGGIEAYKEARYGRLLALHLVGRDRRVPVELVSRISDFVFEKTPVPRYQLPDAPAPSQGV